MLRLSLIIPTYNRPKDIMRLLKNLNLQTRKPDEVIIVDASDTEETKMLVEYNKEEFTYPISYYSHEKGLTRQRNFGVSKARYDIIGFSDDDSLYAPDFMARINAIFERDQTNEIGGASGLIFNVGPSNILAIDDYLRNDPKEAEVSAFMERFVNIGKDTWSTRLRKGLERVVFLQKAKEGTFCAIRCRFYGIRQSFAGTKTVDFLRGIAFYRKKVFEQVLYADFFEGYGFAEDVHFSLQVGKRWKLMVDGEAFSYHLHSPSGRPDLFKVGIMSTRNYFYIFRTYSKRGILEYIMFWYYFILNALLDFSAIVLLRNSDKIIRLFMGRCYGGILVVRDSFKRRA
jgi:glycosyltransferase involved in cell wall biosynthesis